VGLWNAFCVMTAATGGNSSCIVSRRAVLGGGLAAGASFGRVVPLLAANQAERSLRYIAGGLRDSLRQRCDGVAAPGGDSFTIYWFGKSPRSSRKNEMKWLHMSTAPFSPITEWLTAWSISRWRMAFYVAGTICSGTGSTPKWFKELSDRATARTAMLRRVTDMVSRYRGRIDSWTSSTAGRSR